MHRRLQATVHGRVQMVGFRYFVTGNAEALGLTGWVRNGADGATVEVVAEGDEATLRELETDLREGPSHARVESVHVGWQSATGEFDSFDVRF